MGWNHQLFNNMFEFLVHRLFGDKMTTASQTKLCDKDFPYIGQQTVGNNLIQLHNKPKQTVLAIRIIYRSM